jgi:hypothetical protein
VILSPIAGQFTTPGKTGPKFVSLTDFIEQFDWEHSDLDIVDRREIKHLASPKPLNIPWWILVLAVLKPSREIVNGNVRRCPFPELTPELRLSR